MSIITYPLNNVDYDASDAELYNCTRTSGVYSSDSHFSITISGSRKINIGKGIAWIKNSEFAGKAICNTEGIELTLEPAESILPRIDRIVIGFNATQNATSIYIKKGTPSSNPIAPGRSTTVSLYELVLCDVYIPAGSVDITALNITDRRNDETLCGVMRDGVTHIPTAVLVAQFEALLEQMKAAIVSGIPSHSSTHADGGVDALIASDTVSLSSEWVTATTTTMPSTTYCSYFQIVNSSIIKATNDIIVGISSNATKEQRESATSAQLFAYAQKAGNITVCVASGAEKPSISIPIQLIALG